MSNRFYKTLKLCLVSLLVCLSACSFGANEGFKQVEVALSMHSDVFGIQGCTFKKNIYFRGGSEGRSGIYKYEKSAGEFKAIKNFLYVGSLTCEDDGVYFSAVSSSNKLNLYLFDGKTFTMIKEKVGCSVLSKIESNRFVCYKNVGFSGGYSIGVTDLVGNSYRQILPTEQYGMSEGFFIVSGDFILGAFLDNKTKVIYLKSIILETGEVVASLILDCERFSIISMHENQLMYKCGAKISNVNGFLERL